MLTNVSWWRAPPLDLLPKPAPFSSATPMNWASSISAYLPGDADRTTCQSPLLTRLLGTTESADGQVNYTPDQTTTSGRWLTPKFDDDGTNNIGIDVTGFDYLFAKYHGPNYGSAFLYAGDLLETLKSPADSCRRWAFSAGRSSTGVRRQRLRITGATASLLGAALMVSAPFTRQTSKSLSSAEKQKGRRAHCSAPFCFGPRHPPWMHGAILPIFARRFERLEPPDGFHNRLL